jgi:transcriptional regulator with XRE-family HTH domain
VRELSTERTLTVRGAVYGTLDLTYAQYMGNQPLPQYLRMHRRRAALTQPELASLLGFATRSKVVAYERGPVQRSARDLLAYAIVFNTHLGEMFEGAHRATYKQIGRRASKLLDRVVHTHEPSPQFDRKLLFLRDLIDRIRPLE